MYRQAVLPLVLLFQFACEVIALLHGGLVEQPGVVPCQCRAYRVEPAACVQFFVLCPRVAVEPCQRPEETYHRGAVAAVGTVEGIGQRHGTLQTSLGVGRAMLHPCDACQPQLGVRHPSVGHQGV